MAVRPAIPLESGAAAERAADSAPSYMRKVHDAPSFIKFWYAVEGTNYYTHRGTPAMRNGPHSDVHLFIGGVSLLPPIPPRRDERTTGQDMAAIPFSVSVRPHIRELVSGAAADESVQDPLFFLHHGKVDQLWAKWQARDPSVRRDASNRLAYSGNVGLSPSSAHEGSRELRGMTSRGSRIRRPTMLSRPTS